VLGQALGGAARRCLGSSCR